MTKTYNKFLIVARFTFVEIIKSNILLNVVILGLVLLMISFVAYSFTYGVPERVALDFGLGSLSISSVGIAIFMGASLISKEIENRTIHMVLSRPISRISFLVGRILGMVGVLLLNIFILSIMTIGFFFILGGKFEPLIFWAILFSSLEAILCLLIVIFFSLLTTEVMAVIYTITTFVLGHAINDTMLISYVKEHTWINVLLKIYSFFFPNFSKLNIKDYVLYKQHLPIDFLAGAFTYGILYCALLVWFSSLIFEKKNLD